MYGRRITIIAVVGLFWLGLAVSASALGQAFGRTLIANIRGLRVTMYVPNPPNGLTWTAGPLAICNDTSCQPSEGDEIVETGWIKGTDFGLGNQIRQYVAWQGTSGGFFHNYFVGTALNANTWYQFQVLYSNSANRWEAWRGTSIPWYQSGLGWTQGQQAAIGGEAKANGDWMSAVAYQPQYKVGTGSWTLFNYGYAQTSANGCVSRVYDYGHQGYTC